LFRKTVLLIVTVAAAAIIFISVRFLVEKAGKAPSQGGSFIKRASYVLDNARVLTGDQKAYLEEYLSAIHEAIDVECVALSEAALPEGQHINQFSAASFEKLKLGQRTKTVGRGLLFVLARAEEMARFEVGYELEKYFTDAFIGYVERDLLKPYFAHDKIGEGLTSCIEHIVSRALLYQGGPSQRRAIANIEAKHGSGGGGATEAVPIGQAGGYRSRPATPEERERFVAQPTPERAIELYKEWLRKKIPDWDLEFFTPETRERFKGQIHAPAKQDLEYREIMSSTYVVQVRDDRAVAKFPVKDRLCNPLFLRRAQTGWQMDIVAMARTIVFGTLNQWMFNTLDTPYDFAFLDLCIDVHGFPFEKKAVLGVAVADADVYAHQIPKGSESDAKQYGHFLSWVEEGKPGHQAGLRVGDILIRLGGIPVQSPKDLTRITGQIDASKPAEAVYVRKGQTYKTKTSFQLECPSKFKAVPFEEARQKDYGAHVEGV
jgi:hypothetical protein